MGKQNGFTLIEMMVAIAIIAILSAITIPNYITYRNNQQVSRAAREIYSALQSAKMTAISDNTAIHVAFTTGTGAAGTYQVFEDLNNNDAFDSPGDRDIGAGQMPPGVTIQSAAFAGGGALRFTFMGLTTGRNGRVSVTNGDRTADVVVNQVGGIRVD